MTWSAAGNNGTSILNAVALRPSTGTPTTYTITASSGGNGSITPSGAVSVSSGNNQTFTISPSAGYKISDVRVDGASVGVPSSYTFTNVTANHTIAASFVLSSATTYTITASSGGNGSITPSGAVNVSSGNSQAFAINPSAGYKISQVSVDGAPQGAVASYTFSNVTANHTIVASFERSGYAIISSASHGSISPLGTVSVPAGGSQSFSGIQPDAGYTLNRVLVDGASVGAVTSYSFTNVQADHTIEAQFLAVAGPPDPSTCLDISDIPLEVRRLSAPANIMVLLDDSGSMDAETLIPGYGGQGASYVFDNPCGSTWTPQGCHEQNGAPILGRGSDRLDWNTQWFDYNKLYYNPAMTYEPWPTMTGQFANSDPNTPRSYPLEASRTFNLSASYDNTTGIDIKNAHYYVWSTQTSTPYLVIIDGGAIRYYQVNDFNDNGRVNPGELAQAASPPADVASARTYAEERQNFANWFTFYRRRIFAAQNAIGKLIKSMQGVRIGIYCINKSLVQPVLPIKVNGEDMGPTLLSGLYAIQAGGMTPLLTGLEAVGRYYDKGAGVKLNGAAGDDGPSAPWYSDANGGSCQQAFTLMITDGYYNGDSPAIGNVDGNNGVPYADSYSNTLADVAMYYYERDLNGTLNNNSPINPYDDATHQHMVTYAISLGIYGTLSPKYYDANLKHKDTGLPIVWPNPNASDPAKIDDYWHAAVNGRGKFLTAISPAELTASLQEVMQNVELRLKTSSQMAVSGDKLYQKLTPDLLMFQNTYSSDGWTGDIKAYKVNPDTGAVDTTTPDWSASEKLQSKAWGSRIIATHTGADGAAGIPFQYNSLTAAQKSQLDANYQSNPTNAQNLVNFLRGDFSKEVLSGGTFRNRFSRLGDIVHSAPVFEDGILYAGSNDGMLHAFNANTGVELFAYVPNLVFNRLKELSYTNYAHRYFVDLTPAVSDLKFGASTKTLLVGGLGKGGRGYFALDVSGLKQTNVPADENALAQKVLWEYPRTGTTNSEIADLGYSFSRPNIVRSNDTAAPGIVIFGNGYDSSNGHAVLYILRADTGELLKRIDTGVGDCNGLSPAIAVNVDYDNDNKADYVYAGDLKGNLWKFDLTSTDYNNWGVAYSSAGTPKPLFQTPGQPITTKPNVMYHCSKHGYMVLFGTGRYLNEADLSDSSSQAVYGIWDYGDDVDDGEYVGTLSTAGVFTNINLPGTVTLLQQTVADTRTVNGMQLRTMSAQAANWKTTSTAGGACGDNTGTEDCDRNGSGSHPDPVKNVGWYFNLPGTRERVVSDVIVRSGVLTVVSHAPSNSLCGGVGESWLMTFDACSGARLSKAFFDISNDGKIDTLDLVNIGTSQNPILVVPSGIGFTGKIQPPAYLIKSNGTEIAYVSGGSNPGGSGGPGPIGLTTQVERAAKLGMTYWRVMH